MAEIIMATIFVVFVFNPWICESKNLITEIIAAWNIKVSKKGPTISNNTKNKTLFSFKPSTTWLSKFSKKGMKEEIIESDVMKTTFNKINRIFFLMVKLNFKYLLDFN